MIGFVLACFILAVIFFRLTQEFTDVLHKMQDWNEEDKKEKGLTRTLKGFLLPIEEWKTGYDHMGNSLFKVRLIFYFAIFVLVISGFYLIYLGISEGTLWGFSNDLSRRISS